MQRLSPIQFIRVVFIVIIFLLAPTAASADDLVVAPAYQTIDLVKGQSATSDITLTNNTDKTVTFNLFTLNFSQNDKGLIEFLGQDNTTYSYALASYISLPQDSVTVDAHSKETITITVNDRQDLSPGGHYAAVVAQADKGTTKIKGATQFTPALASLLLLRKTGGEIFNLSLKEVSWPYRFIQFNYPKKIALSFQNEGNIHVIPRGRIEIYDIFGRLVHKGILNTASQYVFPSSRRTIEVPISRVAFTLPISIDRIVIKGNDSLNKVSYSYRETYIYVNPFAGGAFILIVCATSYIIARRRKK